jgi:hypothetical protein
MLTCQPHTTLVLPYRCCSLSRQPLHGATAAAVTEPLSSSGPHPGTCIWWVTAPHHASTAPTSQTAPPTMLDGVPCTGAHAALPALVAGASQLCHPTPPLTGTAAGHGTVSTPLIPHRAHYTAGHKRQACPHPYATRHVAIHPPYPPAVASPNPSAETHKSPSMSHSYPTQVAHLAPTQMPPPPPSQPACQTLHKAGSCCSQPPPYPPSPLRSTPHPTTPQRLLTAAQQAARQQAPAPWASPEPH